MIGPFIGAVPALFIAFTAPNPAHGQIIPLRPGWPLALGAAVVMTIVQQIDNRLISPHTVANTTHQRLRKNSGMPRLPPFWEA